MKKLKLLFIGNSHTYYNDMPATVMKYVSEAGFDCDVTMIAHPNRTLLEHSGEPEVHFNILNGRYDYVILQDRAHPFGPVGDYEEGVKALDALVKKAGAKTVLYLTWAQKSEREVQTMMTGAHERVAEKYGAALAPVGKLWWEHVDAGEEMFASDGQHASPHGSDVVAGIISETVIGIERTEK